LGTHRAALLNCHGIGALRADQYGDEILEIIAADTGEKLPDESTVSLTTPPTPSSTERNESIVEHLKQWREQKAAKEQVPAFVILHDKTIEQIATVLPRTEAELLQVAGIGPAKLENYGDEILAIIAAHPDSGTQADS